MPDASPGLPVLLFPSAALAASEAATVCRTASPAAPRLRVSPVKVQSVSTGGWPFPPRLLPGALHIFYPLAGPVASTSTLTARSPWREQRAPRSWRPRPRASPLTNSLEATAAARPRGSCSSWCRTPASGGASTRAGLERLGGRAWWGGVRASFGHVATRAAPLAPAAAGSCAARICGCRCWARLHTPRTVGCW